MDTLSQESDRKSIEDDNSEQPKPNPEDELVGRIESSGYKVVSSPDVIETTFIGNSREMQDVYRLIRLAAPSDTSVNITGRTGTGKELVAKSIHGLSKRQEKPFVAINCATLTDTLLASELFGHEKGAFTGAIVKKRGFFEIADGGTLFLDEVVNMGLLMQHNLLRVLQENEFYRVGGQEPVNTDTRVVTASSRGLETAVASGKMLEELYYRLSVIPINLPPLNRRGDDIALLAKHYCQKFSRENERNLVISESGYNYLNGYDFPGNVRELINIIETAVVMKDSKYPPGEPGRLNKDDFEGIVKLKRTLLREAIEKHHAKEGESGTQQPGPDNVAYILQNYALGTDGDHTPYLDSLPRGDLARILDTVFRFITTSSKEEIEKVILEDRIQRFRYDKDAAQSLGISPRAMSYIRKNVLKEPLRSPVFQARKKPSQLHQSNIEGIVKADDHDSSHKKKAESGPKKMAFTFVSKGPEDAGEQKGYERKKPAGKPGKSPTPKRWYESGAYPILVSHLSKLNFTKQYPELREIARSSQVYTDSFGDQRKRELVYVTPDNLELFIDSNRMSKRQQVQLEKFRKDINKGKFNKIARSPFRFYNLREIMLHDHTYSNAPPVKKAISDTKAYLASQTRGDLIFTVTPETAQAFFPENLDYRFQRIKSLVSEIKASYRIFRDWKP